jgi:hypothetical protein
MLELGVRQQLAAVVELVRQTSPELQPGVLERLRTELEGDVRAESERGVAEMVPVFQRRLTPRMWSTSSAWAATPGCGALWRCSRKSPRTLRASASA